MDFNICIVYITDRDADVQHFVPIDDIVTTTALDDIATAATKQNITTNEHITGVYTHKVAKKVAKSVNAVDAFLGQFMGEQRDFIIKN